MTVFRNRTLTVLFSCALVTLAGVLTASGAFAALEDDIRAHYQEVYDYCFENYPVTRKLWV